MTPSLEVIYASCDEIGDCMIWRGGVTGSGQPSMRVSPTNKARSARRVVYELLHPDQDMTGLYATPKCRNKLCLSGSCLVAVSMSKYMRGYGSDGAYSHPLKKQRIARSHQAITGRTMQDARDIRAMHAQGKSNHEIAERYGIAYDTVRRIVQGKSWREQAQGASVFTAG